MKLYQYPAPHIRYPESNQTMMSDVLLLLALLTIPAYLFYGPRTLVICLVSVSCAAASDCACVMLRGHRPNVRDLSPVVTGMITALMMPASIPYGVVACAAVFAIVVAKQPFGGAGGNLFNPAAAGVSFAAICWPQQMFLYPAPFSRLDVFGTFSERLSSFVYQSGAGRAAMEVVVPLTQNPSFVLKSGRTPTNSIIDMALGNYPGPMGATNILVILACLVYLILRRGVRWHLPVSFLGACAAIAFIFPRVNAERLTSVCYELMSGALLFGAVFMMSDPVTSPKRDSSLAIYGVFAGVCTMLFRYFGGFEESIAFTVLFANAFVPIIDRYNEYLQHWIRRRRFEARKIKSSPPA